jgi:threonine/homoserine/homoserine lactone efflux protein
MITPYVIGCIALIIKPGPDLMCTLATAISEGKARASTLMAGLILGCWLWVALLAAGVASFFTDHPTMMTAIQIVGVAYIGYLAFGSSREAWAGFRQRDGHALTPAAARGWRLVGRGIFMSMSNPLTILFFLAFLPNFTREDSACAPAVQVLLLGTLFCALVPFIYFPIILVADFFRARLVGSVKATASLKLVSAPMLVAVVAVPAGKIISSKFVVARALPL